MQSIRPNVERTGGRLLLSGPLFSVLLLTFSSCAHADDADAFNFFVGSSVTYDDNVFRLSPDSTVEIIPGSTARSDTITMTYVGGNFRKTLGRQTFWADINFNQSRYNRFSFLDFDGHNNAIGWDWRMTNLLSGHVGKKRSLQMAGFADLRRTVQNLYTDESEYANADVWFAADWHLDLEAKRFTRSYEAEINQTGNSIVDSRKIGVRFTPRDRDYIAVRVIDADGNLPNQQVLDSVRVDNSYHQKDVGVEFSKDLTGLSRIRGVLNRTEREHINIPERDFSGMTGNLTWDWAITGKTLLSSQLRREIGASNDFQASYIITNGANITATWQATGKTTASLRYEKYFRDFAGNPFIELEGLEKRKDRLDTLSFNVNYEPIRSVQLSLSLVHSTRESNVPELTFDDNMATLGAQFSF